MQLNRKCLYFLHNACICMARRFQPTTSGDLRFYSVFDLWFVNILKISLGAIGAKIGVKKLYWLVEVGVQKMNIRVEYCQQHWWNYQIIGKSRKFGAKLFAYLHIGIKGFPSITPSVMSSEIMTYNFEVSERRNCPEAVTSEWFWWQNYYIMSKSGWRSWRTPWTEFRTIGGHGE